MALLSCPDCDGKVSSRAGACPHCGLPGEHLTGQRWMGTATPDPGTSAGEVLQGSKGQAVESAREYWDEQATGAIGALAWIPSQVVFYLSMAWLLFDVSIFSFRGPDPPPTRFDLLIQWLQGLLQ